MSGMKWFLVALVGCGLLVFYVSRSRQESSQQAPEQTDIGQTAESLGQELTGQVIEHSVLRKWNPNNDFRGLGLEIMVSEDATEDQLVELIKTLADEKMAGGAHVVVWNGKDSSGKTATSGIYIYKITSGNFIDATK
ncbi:MAG: hypothetical protein ACE1ZI_00115, partial [Acidobacteriota bacterium]